MWRDVAKGSSFCSAWEVTWAASSFVAMENLVEVQASEKQICFVRQIVLDQLLSARITVRNVRNNGTNQHQMPEPAYRTMQTSWCIQWHTSWWLLSMVGTSTSCDFWTPRNSMATCAAFQESDWLETSQASVRLPWVQELWIGDLLWAINSSVMCYPQKRKGHAC